MKSIKASKVAPNNLNEVSSK